MTPARVTIRDFAERDTTGVIALARQLQSHERGYYDRMKPVEDMDTVYVANLVNDVQKHQGRFLVAEHAATLVGYCTLLTHCDSSDEFDEVFYTYAYVGDLVVAEDARGQGVGAALIAACEDSARAAKQKWLRLSVMAANANARRFYAAQGFAEHLIRLEKPL